jgi:hypothetical protein
VSELTVSLFNYRGVFPILMSRLFAAARWGDLRCLPFTPRPCRVRAVPFNDLGFLHQLADQFHRRPRKLHADRAIPDPRTAQIARLTTENTTLRTRLAATPAEVHELTAFKILTLMTNPMLRYVDRHSLQIHVPPPGVRRCDRQRMLTWKVEF